MSTEAADPNPTQTEANLPEDEHAYTTERGFHGFARFTDTYGAEVRVQESSAAMGPHLWLMIDGEAHLKEAPRPFAGLPHGLAKANQSSHLNVAQARQVRDAIDQWLREIPERWDLDSLTEDDQVIDL